MIALKLSNRPITTELITDYCLKKNGAYLDFPFGLDCAVIKVKGDSQEKGRIFAQLFRLKGQDSITLNCDIMTGMLYRDMFPNIVVRGYHCPPVQQPYFNTFPLDGSVPNEIIIEMIEHSYKTVISKLPKYIQRELET